MFHNPFRFLEITYPQPSKLREREREREREGERERVLVCVRNLRVGWVSQSRAEWKASPVNFIRYSITKTNKTLLVFSSKGAVRRAGVAAAQVC